MIKKHIWDDDKNQDIGSKVLVSLDETETVAIGRISLTNGEATEPACHEDEEEIFVILKGKGKITVGDEKQEIEAGSIIYIPRNYLHYIHCTSEEKLEYLYFANWPDIKDNQKEVR